MLNNYKGNQIYFKNGDSAILLDIFTRTNNNHPWREKEMGLYWKNGENGTAGYAGYILMDNITISDIHVTDKSVYDLFKEQHLENWKEDEYYNFVNYDGIRF